MKKLSTRLGLNPRSAGGGALIGVSTGLPLLLTLDSTVDPSTPWALPLGLLVVIGVIAGGSMVNDH